MDGYLAKPIDVDELIGALRRATGRAESGAAAGDEVAGASSGPGPVAALPPPLPLLPGIALQAALPRFGGSFASFAAVFKRFGRSQGGVAGEVRAALAAGDRSRAGQLVHRLRGVAANLGATDVASRALELEQALRSEDEAALELRLARLEDALAVVLDAARGLPDEASDAADAGIPDAADEMEQRSLRDALAHLRDLLQNNNMKAMAQFESLRPHLARLAPDALPALAEAVATLRFECAADLLGRLLGKEDA
jgi:HPt (histidine-containing phosphotransfer) domain-containing protein